MVYTKIGQRCDGYSAGMDFSRRLLTTKVELRTVTVKNIYTGRRPTTQVFK